MQKHGGSPSFFLFLVKHVADALQRLLQHGPGQPAFRRMWPSPPGPNQPPGTQMTAASSTMRRNSSSSERPRPRRSSQPRKVPSGLGSFAPGMFFSTNSDAKTMFCSR